MIKRDLFMSDSFIFDYRIKLGEDLTILAQVLMRSESVAYVDDYLYYYRNNVSGSLTQSLGAGARFNYMRSVAFANAIVQKTHAPNSTLERVFKLQRINVKRWLLNRSSYRNKPLTLIFRLYCYTMNRLLGR